MINLSYLCKIMLGDTVQSDKPIILFDAYCNLCSASVQTVIRYDPKAKFKLGSLQSEEGRRLADSFGINPDEMSTFLLIKNGKLYTKSTAALNVAKEMSGLWPLLTVFIIVPEFIRDSVYTFIANHRYQWFGKRNSCWLPNDNLKARFIDS